MPDQRTYLKVKIKSLAEEARIIRKEEERRGVLCGSGIPIIMLTALKAPVLDSFNRGCDDYIIKPYDADTLCKKIEEKIHGES